ncbi:MAG: hypothetical protein AAGE59_38465 [Cyanobacteria bacterium P01_F01_bin.86]
MAKLEVTIEQILELIQQLPWSSKQVIFEVLRQDVEASPLVTELDQVSQDWLEAELTDDVPEYDWGKASIPEGLPISYVSGQGLIIPGAETLES